MSSIVLNPKTNTPASYIKNDDTQAINIVRLVEDDKIIKNIVFDELSIDNPDGIIDVQGGNTISNEFGITFPVIRINDMVLSRYNIKSMIVSSRDILPTISLSLSFETTKFIGKNMPKDGDIISTYFRVGTDALAYLRNDFIITSCTVSSKKNNNSDTTVHLQGKMFIPGFLSTQTSKSYTGTTKDVFKALAKEYNLGFSFNDFDDTNDYQNWLKIKQSNEDFFNNLLDYSWKDETSFFNAWIDLYYNICFVNVNKFLLSTENNEEVDITFASNTLPIENLINNNTSVENATLSVKLLTNSFSLKNTPFYIKKWKPVNVSTSVSMNVGYSTTTYTFTHNQNYLNNKQSQCFQTLKNIPAYDQSKTDSFVLLRGRSRYDKNKNPDNEKARVNYDFVDTYNKIEWTGVEYTLHDDDLSKSPNEWSGNVHKNYSRAPYHNRQNRSELNKIYLEVECDGLNLQIMRGERVPVYLFLNGAQDEADNNSFSENDVYRDHHRFYSGYYIVDSIEYKYKGTKGDDTTPYTTKYILKRREWPTPEQI